MKRLTTCLLLVTILILPRSNRTRFALKSHLPASQRSADTTDLYEQGRTAFRNRCGKCHEEDAAKKLPDGTSLVQRLSEHKYTLEPADTHSTKLNKQ